MQKMLNKNERQGIVLKGVGGFYTVLLPHGEILVCRQRGRLRKEEGGIFPGDRVRLELLDEAGAGEVAAMIEEVLPRKNRLLRPKVANISLAVTVLAVKSPAPDWLLLDRILVICLFNRIRPLVCLNKWDMASKAEEEELNLHRQAYQKAGFDIFGVSAVTGFGLEQLPPKLKGEISVLAGPSGVGKSSLLNALFPALDLAVGDISQRLGRGRHTTRQVEMLALSEDTLVADTPGFALLDLPEDLQHTDLPGLYPDFDQYAPCRFEGCLHHKEPDCSIKEALSRGALDAGRYERYLRLLLELQEREVKY